MTDLVEGLVPDAAGMQLTGPPCHSISGELLVTSCMDDSADLPSLVPDGPVD
ncbi:hypothetical protein ACFZDI_11260 [Streptomyces sp. NPDC007907]|uniref:hypothetical protein n=1 Tax=Streptomyces sp. NPDC007907 TaxID=3364789 RepID=UPI0036E00E23